jgi:predicted KAP-like P-loop ATPase
MASEPQPLPLSPDRALGNPAEDRLGLAPFAQQLARSILRGCPADGLVVALYGAWGTGKSTALNFILHYVEQDTEAQSPVIVRFNPWWFAGRRFAATFAAFATAPA